MTLLHGLAGLSRADTSGPSAHCSSRKLMYSFTHRASGFAQTCRPFLVMNLWRQAGRCQLQIQLSAPSGHPPSCSVTSIGSHRGHFPPTNPQAPEEHGYHGELKDPGRTCWLHGDILPKPYPRHQDGLISQLKRMRARAACGTCGGCPFPRLQAWSLTPPAPCSQ